MAAAAHARAAGPRARSSAREAARGGGPPDDEQRTVHELNAEPAAREYAMAVGLDPERLSPMSFAAYPLAVKVGGEYFCRSIRRMNPDGSLSFFCAIDETECLDYNYGSSLW